MPGTVLDEAPRPAPRQQPKKQSREQRKKKRPGPGDPDETSGS